MALAVTEQFSRPIATGPVILRLPVPPSVNGLFAGKARRFVSDPYAEWRKRAGWEIQAQRVPCIVGPVEITITVREPPGKSRADIDNIIKATVDLIVAHHIIPTDDNSCVRAVSARWASVARCVVEIVPVTQ